jgi:outer membrane lipoprotein-sorting protein
MDDSTANTDAVSYNTYHTVHLNNDNFIDAIVTYWLAPPMASGHCIQPHSAMIVRTTNGYIFCNADFVDVSFSLDSAKSDNSSAILYGRDYSCAVHGYTKSRNVIIPRASERNP